MTQQTSLARPAGALLRHPLITGWAWTAAWLTVALLGILVDWPDWTAYPLGATIALPSLLATLAVLQATPREQLRPAVESVLGHFLVRALALTAAFAVWGVSLVLSASISSTIQSTLGGDDREVTALGFQLLLAAVPIVLTVLWMAFVVRCAWFLRRLRGWRERPDRTEVPVQFLHARPALRSVAIGLAHPGLLLVSGLGGSILAAYLAAPELNVTLL